MSYAAKRVEYPDRQQDTIAKNVDPVILRAAKQVYRFYVDSYATQLPRPLGVAVNRTDMSGKLVYTQLILLPQESFVPIELVESSEFH
ncbi:hypothetical protein V2H45_11330 [Tumidithrix elongata RA019]|uniref:Uncharacterized protein n=1 Tax=Tumidithrix elongata BACA0141 TaxID=2716417 RepID=A0AAW9PTF5_9CYAN|nr:hypothetical protein [Tumidithrix elongata RA019]